MSDYVSPAALDEMRRLFADTWHYAATLAKLQGPSHHGVATLGSKSVVITRPIDGSLKGMVKFGWYTPSCRRSARSCARDP
ncbi:hypothetical protein [Nocardioides sp. LS1]|uniref:hypothetical protein n=1 Tax=Nocardioides sp. LS1 TaxID=1027620 RepID=UPI000F6211B7|nr:hypothetical protein [Nocardioides sp. LS1]GCD91198.1 hypothetical protein NLS1_32040 [Nocardioides sp. LS1]